MKKFVLFFVSLLTAGGGFCGFPVSINCGSEIMTDGAHVAQVSLGFFAGFISNAAAQNSIGFFDNADAAYQTFLNSDHPLAVRPEPANAASSKFIVSPDRSLRLAWSDGTNQVPVQYRVYVGPSSSGVTLAGVTADQFYVVHDLEYLKDYSWQIEAFDTYGRATMSAAFTFSIAPSVSHLYCAPNPFRAGAQNTTFIFNMAGPGSATLSVYLLPSVGLVYSASLNGLQDGVNTFEYRGVDDSERVLYNGVYMAVMEKKGGQGNETERFKFLVVK